ncbi:hypothetical protein GCM10025779_08420 [Arthrobacter cryoconiti]
MDTLRGEGFGVRARTAAPGVGVVMGKSSCGGRGWAEERNGFWMTSLSVRVRCCAERSEAPEADVSG